MFFFQPIPVTTWLMAALVLVCIVGINELTRRSKIASLVMYLAVPLFLSVFIWPNSAGAGTTSGYWFAWVKTYSALVGVLGFMAIRHIKRLEGSKFMYLFPALILAINVLEAVYRDYEIFAAFSVASGNFGVVENGLTMMGGSWNILNAIAGIVNIVTITGWLGLKIAKTKSKDMIWPDMQTFWIIAYSIWNIAYGYNCLSDRSFYATLLLCVAAGLANVLLKGAWLQHRAQTLALYAMFTLTFPTFADSSQFAVKSSHNTTALLVLSIASLVANIAVLVYMIYKVKKNGVKNHFKNDVFTDTKEYKVILEKNNL